MCCIRLGLMSGEELEKKINLALKNKRISREFLGTELSRRRVPSYWTYAYLLSNLYGREEANLTFWKDVKINKALYPALEISVTGKAPFLEFRSCKTAAVTLNGKLLEVHRIGNDLQRIYPQENGVIKIST